MWKGIVGSTALKDHEPETLVPLFITSNLTAIRKFADGDELAVNRLVFLSTNPISRILASKSIEPLGLDVVGSAE